jgi:YidC/Oxa1 family membrane protein insertase
MSGSLKGMNTIMPIMSGVFCLMLPIGVGVYWIASAVFTILQTIFINRYLDKTGLDEMIEKNIEKANKKKESLGVSYGNQMAGVAKTTTKTYSSDEEYDNTAYKKNNKRRYSTGGDYKRSAVSYSASSIAANANLLARNTGAPVAEKKETDASANAETPQITQNTEVTTNQEEGSSPKE